MRLHVGCHEDPHRRARELADPRRDEHRSRDVHRDAEAAVTGRDGVAVERRPGADTRHHHRLDADRREPLEHDPPTGRDRLRRPLQRDRDDDDLAVHELVDRAVVGVVAELRELQREAQARVEVARVERAVVGGHRVRRRVAVSPHHRVPDEHLQARRRVHLARDRNLTHLAVVGERGGYPGREREHDQEPGEPQPHRDTR